MRFLHIALRGLVDPRSTFIALRTQSSPLFGLLAVSTRFVLTSLTTIRALRALGVQPLYPSYLTLLDLTSYYAAESYFLPLFGLMIWLVMSAIAASLLAFSGENPVDFTKVLNV